MNDDTLILYYYDELPADERQRITLALESDPQLARRYASLRADLGALGDAGPVPMPAALDRELHARIDRLAGPVGLPRIPKAPRFHFLSFAFGAAATAALAFAFGLGLFVTDVETPPATDSGSPFLRGVQVHLTETQREISSLAGDPAAERQRLIRHIVDQNRLYELSAERNGADDLARVMRAFEPILLRLATEDLSPADADALLAQLNFELDVVLTRLARDSSKQTTST